MPGGAGVAGGFRPFGGWGVRGRLTIRGQRTAGRLPTQEARHPAARTRHPPRQPEQAPPGRLRPGARHPASAGLRHPPRQPAVRHCRHGDRRHPRAGRAPTPAARRAPTHPAPILTPEQRCQQQLSRPLRHPRPRRRRPVPVRPALPRSRPARRARTPPPVRTRRAAAATVRPPSSTRSMSSSADQVRGARPQDPRRLLEIPPRATAARHSASTQPRFPHSHAARPAG